MVLMLEEEIFLMSIHWFQCNKIHCNGIDIEAETIKRIKISSRIKSIGWKISLTVALSVGAFGRFQRWQIIDAYSGERVKLCSKQWPSVGTYKFWVCNQHVFDLPNNISIKFQLHKSISLKSETHRFTIKIVK